MPKFLSLTFIQQNVWPSARTVASEHNYIAGTFRVIESFYRLIKFIGVLYKYPNETGTQPDSTAMDVLYST